MSIDAINWVFELQDITSSEKFVLVAIANRSNEKHEAWPSWSRLIHDTRLCRKTLHKTLVSLQRKGYLIKTGDTVKQVTVYKLCGVLSKEELVKLKSFNKKLSTTSSNITTSSNSATSSKSTTTTSSKSTTGTSSKSTTQNHQLNHQRNHQADSIFLPIKTQIQNQLIKHELEPTTDIIAQIEFYVDTKPDQPEDQTIRVAVNLYKKKKWRIPNGYNGITSQSIIKKEEDYYRQEEAQYQEDGKAYRNVIALLPKHAGEDEITPVVNLSDRPSDRPDKPDRKVALQHLSELVSFLKPSSLTNGVTNE